MSIIPYVIEQTGRGERSYNIFSRLLWRPVEVSGEGSNPSHSSDPDACRDNAAPQGKS